MEIGEKIKLLREAQKLSQRELADRVGYKDRSSIAKVEAGLVDLSRTKIEAFARALNVSFVSLMGGEEREQPPHLLEQMPQNTFPVTGDSMVPIVGSVPAGAPLLAQENILGDAPAPVGNVKDHFWLRVKGDSMVGAGIQSGDLVLIHKQTTADDGKIVVCRLHGDEATLKRFHRREDRVLLLPENPAYEPILLSARDFESGDASIIGQAVMTMRAL